MATGNLGTELHLTVLNSMRKRTSEIAEKKVDCVMPGCDEKQKTFRVIARHFKNKHASEDEPAIKT